MDQVALETWARMEDSRLPGRQFNEASITENNLYTLRTRVPGLLIWQSTAANEAETGADWEWWIGDDAAGWLCVRMQAKRAYPNNRYEQLRHGAAAEGGLQYDKLIRGCDPAQGRYPFHVFYNGWPEGTFRAGTHWAVPAQWNACPNLKGFDECGHAEPRHYGCAIASSPDVKRICDTEDDSRLSIIDHLSHAVPWSYAFGFPPSRQDHEQRWVAGIERGDWLDRIHATLQVLNQGGARGVRDAAAHLPQVPIDPNRRTFVLPNYVHRMRATAPGIFEPRSEDEIPAAPRTIVVERHAKTRARRE